MKKLLATLLILSAFLWNAQPVFAAANTYSIDLERSSSQWLSAADSVSLSITGDITVEVWIKLEQLPSSAGGSMHIFSKGAVGDNSWNFYIGADDKLQFDFHQVCVTGSTDIGADTAFDSGYVGAWTHLAVVVDVSTADGTMYVNGNEWASTPAGISTSICNSAGNQRIGANVADGNYFDGKIDEARIWSGLRTQQQIQDNRSIQLVGDESGLVAYWQLNNGLLDETANNNDLTNNNVAVFSTDVPFVGGGSGATATTMLIGMDF